MTRVISTKVIATSVLAGALFVLAVGSISPHLSYAQGARDDFVPLAPIGGVPTDTKDPSGFFNAIFRIGVGIAALLAVIVIVVGGFEYMTSDVPGQKSDGKARITGAILGLLIILLSWLILYIINPDIVTFKLFS